VPLAQSLHTNPVLHCGLPQLPFLHILHVSVAVLPQMEHNPAMFISIPMRFLRLII
jgi:hypothetical protein